MAQTIHMLAPSSCPKVQPVAQTIYMLAPSSCPKVSGAMVPLANGYFQIMKTSQCQAKDVMQNCVLISKETAAGMEDHRMSMMVLHDTLQEK